MRLFSVLVMMPIVATFGLANAQLSDNETISNEIGTNEIGNKQASNADKPVDLTVLSTNEENVSFVVIDSTEDQAGEDQAGEDQAGDPTGEDEITAALDALADNGTSQNEDAQETDQKVDAPLAADVTTQENKPETAENQDQATNIQEQDNSTNTDDEAVEAEADTAELGQTRITRRSSKDVGLASIGITDAPLQLDGLDNRIWRGMGLDKALMLIAKTPEISQSKALHQMSYQVIARQAVPPKGASDNPTALLAARMDYLSRIGRSDGLAAIVAQLPDTDDWATWKEWKLFYDLMQRDDADACQKAADKALSSLDPLWQKTNLVCQILTGDEARAAFSADVLRASGFVEDDLFFELIDVLLGRRDTISAAAMAETEAVSILHVILMDAAHISITARHLDQLDPSYAKATNALRYLSDEARQKLGLKNLQAGLLTLPEANAIFLASTGAIDTPLMAMTRRLETGSDEAADEGANQGAGQEIGQEIGQDADRDVASVQLYLALRHAIRTNEDISTDEARELVDMILSAIRQEAQDGNGALWLGFYAPLLGQAMSLVEMSALDVKQQSDYAAIMALAGLPANPLPTDGGAVILADHIATLTAPAGNDQAPTDKARLESALAINADALLPLLGSQLDNDTDWLARFHDSPSGAVYQASLSQAGLMALQQAAQTGQRAETVMVAAMVMGAHNLSDISPLELQILASSLNQAGLVKTANTFQHEAIKAHLMARYLSDI